TGQQHRRGRKGLRRAHTRGDALGGRRGAGERVGVLVTGSDVDGVHVVTETSSDLGGRLVTVGATLTLDGGVVADGAGDLGRDGQGDRLHGNRALDDDVTVHQAQLREVVGVHLDVGGLDGDLKGRLATGGHLDGRGLDRDVQA